MLPEARQLCRVVGGELVPSYFTEADHAWLGRLLEEYRQAVGLRRASAFSRLGRPAGAPLAKLRLATHVLARASRDRVASPVPPRALRSFAFEAAARGGARAAVLAETARAFALEPTDVPRWLFADLPGERLLDAPDRSLGIPELTQAANAALVSALLGRAVRVRIAARGGGQDLLRAAQRWGLICVLRPAGLDDILLLEASGPYALFRHTALYGRALAGLLPWVARCDRFALRAECAIEPSGVLATLTLRSGDPVMWAGPTLPQAAGIARRLARDLAAVDPDWELSVVPGPVQVGNVWWWADSELRGRAEPERRWLVEIVRFWTRSALEHKLALARSAELPILLCVDLARNCGQDGMPEDVHLVPFTGRIDPRRLLAAARSD